MSKTPPEVSVIIPAFNAEKTICRAIDSALLENDIEIEIVIVDDGSSDSTASTVREKYAVYQNVKLHKSGCNSGPSVARNIGIENANGRWIALLDADDWYAKNRLSILHKKALEYDVDFIADSYYLCCPDDVAPHSVCFSGLSRPDDVKTMTGPLFIRQGLGSVKPIIKKEFLDKTGIRFNPLVWRGEDMTFFVTLLMSEASFGLLNTPLYYRQDTPGSLTKSDKVRLLTEMHGIYIELQTRVSGSGKKRGEMSRALQYRARVVQDALAAANWQAFIKAGGDKYLPGISSLARAVRHLLLKRRRYDVKATC
ncbi:MAG: glycosyltransferase family 2 protein [Gammaproteobacteria bacterium]|nr:glycosyltransferase family 2 protein [Gammaproteobacteria bacterium]